jgi:hypothetical protein
MLEMDEMIARSLKRSETHDMMTRLTAKRNWDGIVSRLALKTEKPMLRRMYDRYVLGGLGGM